MATPEIEPRWILKAADWAWEIAAGLLAATWSFLKADINRAHAGNAKALEHIESLYAANEADREKSHQMMADLTGTFTAFTCKVTEELGKRPTRDECALFWQDARDNARNGRK